jgi:menaquinone-dependent protoporphyrinogen IX oxidase
MKILICYKTKGGATEKYAKWMAEALKADIKTYAELGRRFDFSAYDTVIVSSGTYMGLMPLNRFLKRNWKRLVDNKVVAVAVGAAPAEDNWSTWSYNRIPHKIREKIQYFKIMGEDPEGARKLQGSKYVSKVKKENIKEILAYLKKELI